MKPATNYLRPNFSALRAYGRDRRTKVLAVNAAIAALQGRPLSPADVQDLADLMDARSALRITLR